jgi:hypothetical protein
MTKEKTETPDVLLKRKDFNSTLEEAERDPVLKKKLYLLGEMTLEEAERNPVFREEMRTSIDSYLTEEEDRALFDLPPKPKLH